MSLRARQVPQLFPDSQISQNTHTYFHMIFLSSLDSCRSPPCHNPLYFPRTVWPLRQHILLPRPLSRWPMTSFRTLPFCALVKMHPLCNALLIGSKVFCVYAWQQKQSVFTELSCWVVELCCSPLSWHHHLRPACASAKPRDGSRSPDFSAKTLVWLLIVCVLTVHICLRATLPRSRRPANRALTCEPGLSGLIWLCAALFTGPGWLTCSQCDMFSLQCSRIEHILTGCNQHSHPHRACHRHRTPLSRVLLLRCCRCRCGLDGFVVYTTASARFSF